MDSNGLNPWIVKQFNLVWLEIIQWFGVVWIINVEGWIVLGGLDLYSGNGLVGFRMGFWPICRLRYRAAHNFGPTKVKAGFWASAKVIQYKNIQKGGRRETEHTKGTPFFKANYKKGLFFFPFSKLHASIWSIWYSSFSDSL